MSREHVVRTMGYYLDPLKQESAAGLERHARKTALFMAQGDDRVDFGGVDGGIQPKQDSDGRTDN